MQQFKVSAVRILSLDKDEKHLPPIMKFIAKRSSRLVRKLVLPPYRFSHLLVLRISTVQYRANLKCQQVQHAKHLTDMLLPMP
jgi:hypothetical protein